MNSTRRDSGISRLAQSASKRGAPTGLVLAAILAIYWAISLEEISRVEGLFSYDPWYHLAVAKEVGIQNAMVWGFNYYNGFVPVDYPTSMWVFISGIQQVAGIDLLFQFKVLGLVARTAAALALYILAVQIVTNRWIALIAPALFLASAYTYWRGLITFPENFAIVFIVLATYGMLRSLKAGRLEVLLALFLAAHLYIHYRSALISFFLLTMVIGYGLSKRVFRPRQVAGFLGLLIVLTIPILGLAIDQYLRFPAVNIGAGSIWAPFATGPAYTPPTYLVYIEQIGMMSVALAALGIMAVIRKPSAAGVLIALWAGLAFLMSRGPELQIYIPPDRMFSYLVPALALLGAIGVKALASVHRKSRRLSSFVGAGFAGATALTMILVLPTIHGWVGFSSPHLEAIDWLNENVESSAVVAVAGSSLIPFYLIDAKESVDALRIDYWNAVVSGQPSLIGFLLEAIYSSSKVYFVTTGNVQLEEGTLVFANSHIRIYEFAPSPEGVAGGT